MQNYWGPGCNQGPVVTFNLKREDGSWVGHREVEKLSVLSNIQLRVRIESNFVLFLKFLFVCFEIIFLSLHNYILCKCLMFETCDDIDHQLSQ